MIIGLTYWKNDRPDKVSTYYSQDNNATEKMIAKSHNKMNWFETCGPTAATILVAARGGQVYSQTPGGYNPQPEDVLTLFFHDPYNYEKLMKARPLNASTWMGNRVPQWYTVAVPAVYGAPCQFCWGNPLDVIENKLSKNIGIMAQLNKPGHYIAIVAYDTETKEIIINDPWTTNYWPERLKGKATEKRRLKWDELNNNIANYYCLIGE